MKVFGIFCHENSAYISQQLQKDKKEIGSQTVSKMKA